MIDMRTRLPSIVPRDAQESRAIRVWRDGGLADGSIAVYLSWIRRFRGYWRTRGVDHVEKLTETHVLAYASSYRGPRRGRRVKAASRYCARNALHAWSCALDKLGDPVPPWRLPRLPTRSSPLIHAYGEYRRSHRGVAATTLVRDQKLAKDFVSSLQLRGRTMSTMRAIDVDHFVDTLSARLARRTTASLCSSLRCFLRFLRATGRVSWDPAACVVAPRYRTDEHPPRALPWDSVRRILRAIARDRPLGRRDYVMVLLLATYGLGASEVVRLRLDDIDWCSGILRARRAKTAVPIELPLLPAVARALAEYVRKGRPRGSQAREIFLTGGLPHRSLTTSVLRHQVRKYAERAGVASVPLGAHVFRHSHATRQIDAGVSAKIVGDILGHRRPSSTSAYVRVALRRLRTVALPVPR